MSDRWKVGGCWWEGLICSQNCQHKGALLLFTVAKRTRCKQLWLKGLIFNGLNGATQPQSTFVLWIAFLFCWTHLDVRIETLSFFFQDRELQL